MACSRGITWVSQLDRAFEACPKDLEKPEPAELTMPYRHRTVRFGKPVEMQGQQSFRSKGGDPPTIAGLHLGSVRSGRDNF